MKRLLAVSLVTTCLIWGSPPDAAAVPWFGAEVRLYPAGVIGDFRLTFEASERELVLVTVGGNWTDRRDWGKHQNEEGQGPGIGLGWLHRFGVPDGWILGARIDVWRLEIDWTDPDDSGTTKVTVFQPTAQGGYLWLLGNSWAFEATLSLGAEINVSTDGEAVGEGAIVLGGASLSYRF